MLNSIKLAGWIFMLVIAITPGRPVYAQQTLLELLSHSNCVTACWLGITSGITSEDDVIDILTNANIQYEKKSVGTGGALYSYEVVGGYTNPLVNPNFNDSIVIFVNSGVVSGIFMSLTNVAVNDVVAAYGAPTNLIDLGGASITLTYPQSGLVFFVIKTNGNFIHSVSLINEATVERGYINDPFAEAFPACSAPDQLCAVVTATPTPENRSAPTVRVNTSVYP
jgi:hypothetical protein